MQCVAIMFSSALTSILRFAAAALQLLGFLAGTAQAQESPRPPCGAAPVPAYADGGARPNMRIIRDAALVAWSPPACTGWPQYKSGVVVALAGKFRFEGSGMELLSRFAAVSSLRGIRYWSVTDKQWRVLVTDAWATGAGQPAQRRADFNPGELRRGAEVFFAQEDSRSLGEVMYRMRVKEADNDRLVVELENVSRVRAMVFTLFDPGELKSLYFFERSAGGFWQIYALAAAGGAYAERSQASLVNRAAAYYRYFSGAPTDMEPALAP